MLVVSSCLILLGVFFSICANAKEDRGEYLFFFTLSIVTWFPGIVLLMIWLLNSLKDAGNETLLSR